MYEVGDLIVYGRTGICEVTEITTLKMDECRRTNCIIFCDRYVKSMEKYLHR